METWREELYHSGKGTTWGNHAYVARENVNGTWKYFYSITEYEAWQRKSGAGNTKKTSRIPEKDYKEDPKKKTASTAKKASTSTSDKTSSTGKKKSGKGSSGKSSGKKKSGSKSSKAKGSKTAKEKATKEPKALKEKKEPAAKKAGQEKVKVVNNTPVGLDFIKKAFNLKDADIKTRIEKDPVKLESLIKNNNDDDSFGYLLLNTRDGKTETVRWSKYNGQVTLKKFDSDEPMTFQQLPRYMTVQEIKINKKK